MLQLKKYILPHIWFILLTMTIKFFGTMVELLIPNLMRTILDDIVPVGDRNGVLLYSGIMLLCAVVYLASMIISNRMAARSAGKITKKIRHDLFQKLQSLSSHQMDELTVSSAQSRLTSDTYQVNNMLSRLQRVGVRAPMLLIGGLAMMLSMDWVLALIMVVLLPAIGFSVALISKHSSPLFRKQQKILDRIVLTVQENITGIRVIKALSKTEYEKQRFDDVNNEMNRTGLRAGTISGLHGPVATLLLNIGLTLAILVGAHRVGSGAIKAGVVVAFLQYFTQMLNATLSITNIIIMFTRADASAKRISEVLHEPEDLMVLSEAEAPEADTPYLEFRNVTFSYKGVGSNVSNISFRLEKGQTLGILGSTGSGKTTIINLLLRLYDTNEGQILIEGRDIRTIPKDELRKKFGIVFQNDFIAEGTIADNIRFFRDLSDSDLERAARDAQAVGFISEKDGGMQAEVVARGNNLSGGQRQRLLISRALASDPDILILDDASSALDYHTDSLLRQALRTNYRHTTTVLIAQRISSLQHADLILVLEDGCIIGSGDHRHLLETCEEYRSIAQTQMGDGREGL